MSVHALLADLAEVGVQLIRDGNDLRVRGRPGLSLAPYTEQIRRYKPEILAVLAAGHPESTSLYWMHVAREDVEASKPPTDWDGSLPDGCGWSSLCGTLGPCRRYLAGGPCRFDGDRP
jgi:hypothetical protein